MKVLLINPRTTGYSRSVTTPLGLLSIASCLKRAGHDVLLYDRTVKNTKLRDVLSSFSPDIAGISLISFKSIKDAIRLSDACAARGFPVVWGGPLASELFEAVLKIGSVTAVSIGEGEYTWIDIADALQRGPVDFSAIPGMAYRSEAGEAMRSPERPFADLASLADIDWSLVRIEDYFQSSYECSHMLYLYAAKGCPHNCAFCYNKDFHKCRYRKRPMETLLREIRYLVTEHGMDGIYFADELWCRNVSEMHRVCDDLKSLALPFVWGCQTRIGIFSEEDFRYMYDAGCRWIFFGVESGSERMIGKMNKHIDLSLAPQTFRNCKKAGITAIAAFIVGFPGETEDDLRQTVALIEQLDTSFVNLNYFAMVPGSDIYKEMTEKHLFPPYDDLYPIIKQSPIERLEYNYSAVRAEDLHVVRAHYMWKSFIAPNLSGSGGRFSFAGKVISDAFKSLTGGSFFDFVLSVFFSGWEFLQIFYYSHSHRGIRKKYGIK